MSEKLKPCPFCGEQPTTIIADKGPWKGLCRAFHRCPQMGYMEIYDWSDEPVATRIACWNRRDTRGVRRHD